jgi:hypothetical protein
MKKMATFMFKVMMEAMTCGFAWVCGMMFNAVLYEYTDWTMWDHLEGAYMGYIAILGYMVVRYHYGRKMKEFDEKYMPEMKRIIVVLEEYVKSNDKEDEA